MTATLCCANCRYSRPDPDALEGENYLQCHRNPPPISAVTAPRPVLLPAPQIEEPQAAPVRDWAWPEVLPTDWCGEFSATP